MANAFADLLNDFGDLAEEQDDGNLGINDDDFDADQGQAVNGVNGSDEVQKDEHMNGASPANNVIANRAESLVTTEQRHDASAEVDSEMADAIVAQNGAGTSHGKSQIANIKAALDPIVKKVKSIMDAPRAPQSGDSKMAKFSEFDASGEQELLRTANEKSVVIDDEIFRVTQYIRDHYSARFPDLAKLVPNYVDYSKAVAVIGNTPLDKLATSKDNILGKSLDDFLDRHTVMTIKLQAQLKESRARGKFLDPREWERVQKACTTVIELDEAKTLLTNYVRSRMDIYAPNVTVLVGHDTAAKIITKAGGLGKLAQVPSANLPSMGANNSSTGLATNVTVRNQGFVFYSPFIQDLSLDYELTAKAVRILCAKIILAARCDASRFSPDGSQGRIFRQQAEETIQKLRKPPKQKGHRALPKPDDKPAKRRGGRAARRYKAAIGQTEMSKLQNRVKFNEAEEEVGYGSETEGLGMLGDQEAEGRLRAAQIDSRTRAKVSKKNSNWLSGTATQAGAATALREDLRKDFLGFGPQGGSATSLRAHGLRTSGVNLGTATAAGTLTTINFDSGRNQGVDLADPGAIEGANRKRQLEEGWFASGSSVGPTQPTMDADGFLKPALPAGKKAKTGL